MFIVTVSFLAFSLSIVAIAIGNQSAQQNIVRLTNAVLKFLTKLILK